MSKFPGSFLGNLLLLAIGSLIALGAAEIVVRWLDPEWPRTYAYSETRGWKTLPHLDLTHRVSPLEGGNSGPVRIRTEKHGFRMMRDVGPKRSGVFRVIIIGDSFTFGAWIDEEKLYAVVLENQLSHNSASRVEIVNLGVPAYGVHQERVMLVEEGLPLEPDLVLVALYLGNDLQETLGLHRRVFDPETGGTREAPDHKIVDGRMVPAPLAVTPAAEVEGTSVKGWLRKNLRVYPFLASRLKANPRVRDVLTRLGVIVPPKQGLLPPAERVLRLWSGGVGMASLLRDTPPALEKAWVMVLGHLDAMRAACLERGAGMVVVQIPYKVQLVQSKLDREKGFLGLDDADLDLDKPNRRLAAWGLSRGVPVLDLLPVLREDPDPASLYFREDNHWNGRGNEVAGSAIAEFLVARKLVPAPSSR